MQSASAEIAAMPVGNESEQTGRSAVVDDDFRAIYECELGYVWNTLRRLGVPRRDLEDVAHDTFLVVHRKLEDYDPARPLRPWLYGIAFRVAAHHFRKTRRDELGSNGTPSASTSPVQEERVAESDAKNTVLAALATVPIDQRGVFIMHELDGVAVPTIAEMLEIPINTAYSRLRLARKEFNAAVRRLKVTGGYR